ncbi:extracellular solute-binding protein [Desmospora activa]|uniref:Carbohydrate ABC transporter substrate-binding protein (CUT1 family) n=1 Tax=Desmospora activa DSM 45169 TaxID=1121389 RepID=A0A2T4Z3V2_9BACL|nr:extracellular solute-binding protein [Desmospora activa]PTM56569.1 carbohydrate ABC transporter substrate-binding protein (CUT1 family) [Desmospora activa DSM 45169]
MNKRVLAIVAAFSLALTSVSSGCGREEAALQKEGGKAPFTFRMMVNQQSPVTPDPWIEELLEERTNTDIRIQWVPDGSYNEKLFTAMTTDTLPEAVFMKNQATYELLKDAIRGGQFWEIGPYLDEYEHLRNLNPEVLQNTSVDGKIYGLYQERPLSRQGIIYRKDWADNLGLSAPTTTDDLYQMLKQFTINDPDQNGVHDTFGLSDRNDLVYGAFKTVSSYFGTPNNWGEIDGRLLPEFMHPSYIDTMEFFRKLHREGFINQDFPVTSKKEQMKRFVSGKAGVYIGAMGDVAFLYDDAVKTNPDVELDVQNRIKGPTGDLGIWAIPGYGTVILFPKSSVTTEAELKKILAFFDQLMAPEHANLLQYGMEGIHFHRVEGKANPVEDRALLNREVRPYTGMLVGGPETTDMLEAHYTLDVKVKAEEWIKDNHNFIIHDPTAPLDSDTDAEHGVRLREIITDATYQYILGEIDQVGFDKAVERWKKEGGNKIIAEYNEAYQQSK